jgi:NADPH:quinone reductase-like Zn-dependent oxidoreductase
VKAAYLTTHTGPKGLVLGDLPQPRPGKDDVLVEVCCTAITPTEFSWSPTFMAKTGDPRQFPIVLSHEFSGVVVAVGDGVRALKVGDAVYGMNDWFVNGAQAEYCVAPETAVAIKPASLDHAKAAVVPISALTAWQGLFDRCKLKAGDRVLVHGGSGGVGVFAVQLAHWRGAHVIATASAHNLGFVRELGADEVIDYKATRFEKIIRNIDVLFDVVGGETLERSWSVLSPGGRAVTIVAPNEAASDRRAHDAFFIVESNRAQLADVSQLLSAGGLRAFVGAVFPLKRVREAYGRAQQGGMRGKIAIQVTLGEHYE